MSTNEHEPLRPDVTRTQLEAAAAVARARGSTLLVVHPCWTRLAADLLDGSTVRLGVRIGAPGGASTTLAKMFEADQAIEAGARCIESPLNIGALKSGLLDFVKDDIEGVLSCCRRSKRKRAELYVCIDLALLDAAERRIAAEIVRAAGADGVILIHSSPAESGSDTSRSQAHAAVPFDAASDVDAFRTALGTDIDVKSVR